MPERKRRFIGICCAAVLVAGGAAAHDRAGHAASAAAVPAEQTRWGVAGGSRTAQRTVEIVMRDAMRFVPDRLQFRRGETVRLVFRNEGRQLHEFVLGTRRSLEDHAVLMQKFPGMEHDEPYMAHVPPGQTAEILWTFNRRGEFEFGCLLPGHFQAGMRGRVSVTAR
jgi:uncharacterized cupredoxin-like copper-binding protein